MDRLFITNPDYRSMNLLILTLLSFSISRAEVLKHQIPQMSACPPAKSEEAPKPYCASSPLSMQGAKLVLSSTFLILRPFFSKRSCRPDRSPRGVMCRVPGHCHWATDGHSHPGHGHYCQSQGHRSSCCCHPPP